MLYWLSAFSDAIGPLNVLRYITFRTGGAMITALICVFLFGPWIIDHLRLKQGEGQPNRSDGPPAPLCFFVSGPWRIDHLRLTRGKGQPIRSDGPQSHLVTKKGTPTMGGLMMLFGIVASTLLWANPANRYVLIG